jgi:predicted HNH restriction endonuclease
MQRILVEANLSKAERRAVATLCDGPRSARGLASLLGLSHLLKANQLVGGAARKVFDAAPRNHCIRKWRSEDDYYVGVIAAGRRFENDQNFYWEIRPEVKQAFIELGWYRSPDYAPIADEGELQRRVSMLRKETITTTPAGQEKPVAVATTSQAYVRDPLVEAWVLQNAHGKCEGCGNPAPFTGDDGEPFLESHHVRPLADGGSDKITNAAALCPNCHRRCLLGADRKDFTESLYAKIPRLVRQ